VTRRPIRNRGDRGRTASRSEPLLDVLFVVAALAFFGLALAYVVACDRWI